MSSKKVQALLELKEKQAALVAKGLKIRENHIRGNLEELAHHQRAAEKVCLDLLPMRSIGADSLWQARTSSIRDQETTKLLSTLVQFENASVLAAKSSGQKNIFAKQISLLQKISKTKEYKKQNQALCDLKMIFNAYSFRQ